MVAAVLFDFQKVSRLDRVELTLREVLAVDPATVLTVDLVQERASQENLAAGAASRAFASPPLEEGLVGTRVEIGADEAADLASEL